MTITNAILNSAYGLINNKMHAIYAPSHQLFDNIFYNIDEINLFLDNDIVNSYYYDLYFSNNFLLHTNETKQLTNNSHLKDIVAFHSGPPPNFKKEDMSILFNNLKNSYKIFFDKNIARSWRQEENSKTAIIEYGIPKIAYKGDRDKNVLVFNLEKNNQVQLLYQTIASNVSGVEIVNQIDNIPLSDLVNYISSYKICIDFGSKINSIFAMSCGTECIGPLVSELDNPLMVQITNYNDTISLINKTLAKKTTDETRRQGAEQILSKYNYDTFKNSTVEHLTNLKKKEMFIYE